MTGRPKRPTFRGADEHDDGLPQYRLHDAVEFVALHFELVEVILA